MPAALELLVQLGKLCFFHMTIVITKHIWVMLINVVERHPFLELLLQNDWLVFLSDFTNFLRDNYMATPWLLVK